MVNVRVGRTRGPGPGEDLAYEAAVRLAGECAHGVIGGVVCRPWTGTPSCSVCRRNNPEVWVIVRYRAPDPPPPTRYTVAGHGVFVCQFGIVHGRCRCADTTENLVPCDVPDEHRPKPARRPRTIRPRGD